jgi:protein-disulfide isomerase-like protein with CxxC motif
MNKSVLDKLSKFENNVELSEVKVDLALVDDMQKLRDTYSKIAIDAIKTKVAIQNDVKNLISQLQKAKEAKDNAIKKNEIVKSAAKNIGIEPPTISKQIDDADNFKIEQLLQWAENANK